MSSKPTKASLFWIALFSVAIVVAVLWKAKAGNNNTKVVQPEIGTSLAPSVLAPEVRTQQEEANNEPESLAKPAGSAAKKVVHVPAGEPDPDIDFEDLDHLTFENLPEFASYNLEQAVSGDLYAAARVLAVLEKCRDKPGNDTQIELAVEKELRLNEMRQQYAVNAPDEVFHSAGEIRARLKSESVACRQNSRLFDDKLKYDLDKMAGQGHVVARFLFAIWPPDYSAHPDEFQLIQPWAHKAREYTNLNFEQGEVAGLLAYGHAYKKGVLFTQRDFYLGFAFHLAAYECGYIDRVTQGLKDSFAMQRGRAALLNSSQTARTLDIAEQLAVSCN